MAFDIEFDGMIVTMSRDDLDVLIEAMDDTELRRHLIDVK